MAEAPSWLAGTCRHRAVPGVEANAVLGESGQEIGRGNHRDVLGYYLVTVNGRGGDLKTGDGR